MGRAIFISYRRDDTEGEAGRLFDDLVAAFHEDSVFMDVSGINPGVDFRQAIDENVASCGVLLAIIGPAWCSIKNDAGGRRIDDPNDFVRLEIASALSRKIAVIPVLVHEAKMPRPEDLPDNLKELAFRNSVEITHARWNSDVKLLTQALGRYVAPEAVSDTKPVHATVAVQLPPPTTPAETTPSSRPSALPLVLGVVAAVVLVLGILGYFLIRPHPPVASNPIPAPAHAGAEALAGTWVNPKPLRGNGLARLEIAPGGTDTLPIHAYGSCEANQCDWGTQTATFDGEQAKATWQVARESDSAPARTALITIKPVVGGMRVTVDNTFSDNRSPNHAQFTFVRAQ